MQFYSLNGYYPINDPFDESRLLSSLEKDEDMLPIEKVLYDDSLFPQSNGLQSEEFLRPKPLSQFYKGHRVFLGKRLDFEELYQTFRSNPTKQLVQTAVEDLASIFFSEKLNEISAPLTGKRLDLIKTLTIKESIQQILLGFTLERKIALFLLEMERCQRLVIKAQASFKNQMYYKKSAKGLSVNGIVLPAAGTIERFQFREWFSEHVNMNEVVSGRICGHLHNFIEKKEVLNAFLQVKNDPVLLESVKELLLGLDRDDAILKQKGLLEEFDKWIEDMFISYRDSLLSYIKLFPFIGLVLNIQAERNDGFNVAEKHQEPWIDLFKARFSLKDRVNWKYFSLSRKLVEEAFKNQYFFLRQNKELTLLKELYGSGAEPIFEPYFLKHERKIIPLNLKEFEEKKEKKADKGKRPLRVSTTTAKKVEESSNSKNEEKLSVSLEVESIPLTHLSQLQERLKIISNYRFSYGARVCRFFNINPLVNLEKIRNFKDRGELLYRDVSNEELLKSWKQHCFPPIEVISQDPDFKKRFTRQNGAGEAPGFWLLCRFECEGQSPLDGRVRIGFDVDDGKTVIHRFFNPGNDQGVSSKHIKQTLGDEKLSEEEDLFYQTQKDNQLFFGDQLLEVEGKGVFERIKIWNQLRKMSITAIQIPPWIR